MTPSQQRRIVEKLRTNYSVRQICEVLDFNPNLLYYHPKSDPSEAQLRENIESLALRYPTYGYRRITQLLVNEGYPVGYRRVSRLMKAANLSVSVKRVCRTTNSLERQGPWVNRLEGLDICRSDQVWVGDITYVHLKGRFIYVALLMDVFTRKIRGWQLSQHLTQTLTLQPLEQAFSSRAFVRSIIPIKAFSMSQVLISRHSRVMVLRISVAYRGRPWENGYSERLIRTLKQEEVYLNDYENIHEVERTHRSCYQTSVSIKNSSLSIRVSDTCRISETKLVLTLRYSGPNKRWHFRSYLLILDLFVYHLDNYFGYLQKGGA